MILPGFYHHSAIHPFNFDKTLHQAERFCFRIFRKIPASRFPPGNCSSSSEVTIFSTNTRSTYRSIPARTATPVPAIFPTTGDSTLKSSHAAPPMIADAIPERKKVRERSNLAPVCRRTARIFRMEATR